MGPYQIVCLKRNKTAYCTSLTTQNTIKCHVERLKKYYGAQIHETQTATFFSADQTDPPNNEIPQPLASHTSTIHSLKSIHSFATSDTPHSEPEASEMKVSQPINRAFPESKENDQKQRSSVTKDAHRNSRCQSSHHFTESSTDIISYSDSIIASNEAPAAGESRAIKNPISNRTRTASLDSNELSEIETSESDSDAHSIISDTEEIMAMQPQAAAQLPINKMTLRNRAELKPPDRLNL